MGLRSSENIILVIISRSQVGRKGVINDKTHALGVLEVL